jgi:hypothetical protein
MRTTVASLMVAAALFSAPPAAADKPARGCPKSFEAHTYAEVLEERPNVTPEQFAQVDKNADGVVCVKETPGLYNPIDNTANRP